MYNFAYLTPALTPPPAYGVALNRSTSSGTQLNRSSGTQLNRSTGTKAIKKSAAKKKSSATVLLLAAVRAEHLSTARNAVATLMRGRLPDRDGQVKFSGAIERTRVAQPLKAVRATSAISALRKGKSLRSAQKAALRSYKGWLDSALAKKGVQPSAPVKKAGVKAAYKPALEEQRLTMARAAARLKAAQTVLAQQVAKQEYRTASANVNQLEAASAMDEAIAEQEEGQGEGQGEGQEEGSRGIGWLFPAIAITLLAGGIAWSQRSRF